jgi:hypothetical protein
MTRKSDRWSWRATDLVFIQSERLNPDMELVQTSAGNTW